MPSTALLKSAPTLDVSGTQHPSRLLAAKVIGTPPSYPQLQCFLLKGIRTLQSSFAAGMTP